MYRARVRATGQEVAVKVQRPNALGTISKASGCFSPAQMFLHTSSKVIHVLLLINIGRSSCGSSSSAAGLELEGRPLACEQVGGRAGRPAGR